jgi:hypothetical protein
LEEREGDGSTKLRCILERYVVMMEGTDSRSCPLAYFCISGVEPPGCATSY